MVSDRLRYNALQENFTLYWVKKAKNRMGRQWLCPREGSASFQSSSVSWFHQHFHIHTRGRCPRVALLRPSRRPHWEALWCPAHLLVLLWRDVRDPWGQFLEVEFWIRVSMVLI